ncbi:MAG: hypothetical protein QM644_21745 [Mobilitalea sp.]
MAEFNKNEFIAYLLKGQLHKAVDYLGDFIDKKDRIESYLDIFERGQYYKRTDNATLEKLDCIYQNYYRNVFWNNITNTDAQKILFQELWQFCGSRADLAVDETIEDEVLRIVKAEGYEYLGGKTQGYYGPYIWKQSIRETYEVELPTGIELYTVVMMDGFISRSWLDFLTFGESGAGGWAEDDGTLCCVRSAYQKGSEEDFHISFLKHEAQHAYDKKTYRKLSAENLEYRAKLVELIYWPIDKKIKSILREADNSNPDNSHAIAAHRIISKMSLELFQNESAPEESFWEGKVEDVQRYALVLLGESSKELEDLRINV